MPLAATGAPFPRPPAPVGSYLSPPPRPRNSPLLPRRPARCSAAGTHPPGAARSSPGAGGRDGGLGGASRTPGSCTIVDARGPVASASAAQRSAAAAGTLSERGWWRAALIPPRRPLTPGARSLGSPQRRRRASAPRPSARFLFLPRESARTTRPGRAAAPGSPGQAVSGPGGQGWEGGGAALLTVPPHHPQWAWGFADRSWTVTAAESLISDLVACWGIAVPAGASLRFTVHGARARSHLRIRIGSPRGPEPRIPAWWPCSPCGSGLLGEILPHPTLGELFAGVLQGAKVQGVNGGERKDLAAGSGVLISLLGRYWGLRSGDAPTCDPWRKETVIGLERREDFL